MTAEIKHKGDKEYQGLPIDMTSGVITKGVSPFIITVSSLSFPNPPVAYFSV